MKKNSILLILIFCIVLVLPGCSKKKHILTGNELLGIDSCESIEVYLYSSSKRILEGEEAKSLLDMILSLEYTPVEIEPIEGGRSVRINTENGTIRITFNDTYVYYKEQYYKISSPMGDILHDINYPNGWEM